REREIIALATSQANACQYCLSAHTLLGKNAGLSLEQTRAARAGEGSGSREAAIAGFTKALIEMRGHVDVETLAGFRKAGLSESDLLEIVAN
ncbi:carboxymuconolactone decarboxylase family protein, partial [Acinetobacter baumannii]